MAQDQAALQAFVDTLSPGVAEVKVFKRRDVIWRPDPETGNVVDSVDAAGGVLFFETEVIGVNIGSCIVSFDATDGADKGPPDLRRPLNQHEIEDLLTKCLGAAAHEAGKGRPTEAKAEKTRNESMAKARQLLKEKAAANPPPKITPRYRRPKAPLASLLEIAVKHGHMTQEEAAKRLAEGDDPEDDSVETPRRGG